MEKFAYKPLNSAKLEIRLLKINQSPGDMDSVHCNLQHFGLDKCPSYSALSYTWGEPLPVHNILVAGATFSIRENLYLFLRTVIATSHISNSIWLWVDQICIDQENVAERNHQVNLMASIFSKSNDIWIWLGAASQSKTETMELIRMYAALNSKHHGIRRSALKSTDKSLDRWFFEETVSGVRSVNRYHYIPSWVRMTDSAQDAIKYWMNLTYWSRLWVFQEIYLAKKIIILWGREVLSWDIVQELLTTVEKWPGCMETAMSRMITPKAELVRRTREYGSLKRETISLAFALKTASWTRCQDPRDKVYGLMGVVHTEERLPIDYAKSPVEVFTETASRLCLQHTNKSFIDGKRVCETCDIVADLALDMSILPESLTVVSHAVLKYVFRELFHEFISNQKNAILNSNIAEGDIEQIPSFLQRLCSISPYELEPQISNVINPDTEELIISEENANSSQEVNNARLPDAEGTFSSNDIALFNARTLFANARALFAVDTRQQYLNDMSLQGAEAYVYDLDINIDDD